MTKAWVWRKFGNTTILSKSSKDTSKKSFTINSDIAKQDSNHPDKEVHYTYIGMVSLDEGFPLHMYFNDSIDDTTIVEPLDTFDLEKYKDRITNLDILTTDMATVEEIGISKVMKITPATGLELHEASHISNTEKKSFNMEGK